MYDGCQKYYVLCIENKKRFTIMESSNYDPNHLYVCREQSPKIAAFN